MIVNMPEENKKQVQIEQKKQCKEIVERIKNADIRTKIDIIPVRPGSDINIIKNQVDNEYGLSNRQIENIMNLKK